jgi:hypothetical protein
MPITGPHSSKRIKFNDDPSPTTNLAITVEVANISKKALVVEPKQDYTPKT